MATKGQKLLLATPTLVVAESVAAIAHGGSIGAIVAFGAAGLAYAYADEINALLQRGNSHAGSAVLREENKQTVKNLGYRLLNGKSVRGEGQEGSEPETEPLSLNGEDDLPRFAYGSDVFLFSSVLGRFDPTLHRIFLCRTSDGKDLYCDARDLCHVALAGNTGGGKSSIMRMLMAQLCKASANVLLLNPHYTGYDIEAIGPDGNPCPEDWTPFEPYLLHPPVECRKYAVIEHYLKSTARELIPKRLERRAESKPLGKPYFIVIDELPSIVDNIKATPDYMRTILREGRKVGVFLISASQDFLIKTIAKDSGGGAIRDCYRTVYYVGGDATTARALLKDNIVVAENELGKGVVMFRSTAAQKEPIQVRMPFVDNQALYHLLGPSTYKPSHSGTSTVELDVPGISDLKRQTDQTLGEIERARSFRSESETENLKDLKQPGEPTETPETGESFQMKRPETAYISPETQMKQPGEPTESIPKAPDKVRTYEQAYTYFRSDVDAVIAAIMRLNSKHRSYDREDIKAELGWTNYKQPIIKVVCDKFQIAVPNR